MRWTALTERVLPTLKARLTAVRTPRTARVRNAHRTLAVPQDRPVRHSGGSGLRRHLTRGLAAVAQPRKRCPCVPLAFGDRCEAEGRAVDWALLLPIPASLAAHREVLFSRFGGNVALVHCLRAMGTSAGRSGDAVVAVAEVLYADVQALLAANGVAATVVSVPGGGSRRQCLAAGLVVLPTEASYVLVHDIRSSLACADLVQRILGSLRQGNDVVVPALALVDSVKTIDASGSVLGTADRSLFQSVQYPRGFRRQHLESMVGAVGDDRFDELVATQQAGLRATLIDGDPDAFALEIPRDVGLADAIHTRRIVQQP